MKLVSSMTKSFHQRHNDCEGTVEELSEYSAQNINLMVDAKILAEIFEAQAKFIASVATQIRRADKSQEEIRNIAIQFMDDLNAKD